ncbi:hypothetical protein GCM10027612_32770 [Microbispora bryophytorum subsp. camponoti]
MVGQPGDVPALLVQGHDGAARLVQAGGERGDLFAARDVEPEQADAAQTVLQAAQDPVRCGGAPERDQQCARREPVQARVAGTRGQVGAPARGSRLADMVSALLRWQWE